MPVPYPGHRHATGQEMNVWLNTDSNPGNVGELFKLILSGPASLLKTALSAVAYGSEPTFDLAELWYMTSWHVSPTDATEHCTFRLFRPTKNEGEWRNTESYHLYKNGSSKGWRDTIN